MRRGALVANSTTGDFCELSVVELRGGLYMELYDPADAAGGILP